MSERTFEGQVAIVTGAGKGTGGLGRAIALSLARGGARVMLADVDPKVAESAAEVAAETGVQTLHCVGSLAAEDTVRRMVDQTHAQWGRVDILVNNAGGGIIRPFLLHDAASLTETIARNLWTAIWHSQPCRLQRRQGRGDRHERRAGARFRRA